SLCNLFKPAGGFRTVQYGGTFTLIDTSKYNTSGQLHWLLNGAPYDSSYTVNYQFTSASGSATIMELSGTGCRTDTVSKTLNLPGINSYAPTLGQYNSDFNLDIYGAGLDTSMKVYLKKGDTLVYAYAKYVDATGQHMMAVFDFHPYAFNNYSHRFVSDNYQLHMIYPNGYEYHDPLGSSISMLKESTTGTCKRLLPLMPVGSIDVVELGETIRCLPGDLQTEAPEEPHFIIHLTGQTGFRTGYWHDMSLTITNTGKVVAKQIPFYVLMPGSFDVDTTQWMLMAGKASWMDSIGVTLPLDTVINGKLTHLKLLALLQPVLSPGETKSIPFRVRTTESGTFDLSYWTDKRMFGSPIIIFFPPCFSAKFDFVLGFIPVVGCVAGAFDLASQVGQAGVQTQNAIFGTGVNLTPLGSMPGNMVGAAVSCIPGGAAVKGAEKGIASGVGKVFWDGFAVSGENIAFATLGGGLQGSSYAYNRLAANGALDPCSQIADENWEHQGIIGRLGWDPNHIMGNSQYDTAQNFINNLAPQYYTIGFENKPAATANAQHVIITDTLDRTAFAKRSLVLSKFTIGDSSYTIPAFRQSVTMDVNIPRRNDMKVRFTANYDSATGILRADYFSIDMNGHVLNPSSLDGFLPPDVDGVSGTGSLSYSVYAQDQNTGNTFTNKAFIYFDANAPIVTNTWLNTVDTTSPEAKIINVVKVNDSTVKLVVSSADIGSGYQYSTLYVKKATDSGFVKMGAFIGDTVVFVGAVNQSFQFYVRGTDNVGNLQHRPAVADVTYTFASSLPVRLLSFNASKDGARVKVLWVASDETNFSHYEVERSADGSSFTKLATVSAKGGVLTNNYQIYDEHPLVHNNYYRLKQVDNNGSFSYSRTVRVDFDKAYTVAVSPVPAHGYVIIDGAQAFKEVQFIDITGAVVLRYGTA
ncbi:MAG: hypothetical protein JST39_02910, partial [Bacteroidetes bacterium]|nr:hypothetical protein [Bacteroidota bacterium]